MDNELPETAGASSAAPEASPSQQVEEAAVLPPREEETKEAATEQPEAPPAQPSADTEATRIREDRRRVVPLFTFAPAGGGPPAQEKSGAAQPEEESPWRLALSAALWAGGATLVGWGLSRLLTAVIVPRRPRGTEVAQYEPGAVRS